MLLCSHCQRRSFILSTLQGSTLSANVSSPLYAFWLGQCYAALCRLRFIYYFGSTRIAWSLLGAWQLMGDHREDQPTQQSPVDMYDHHGIRNIACVNLRLELYFREDLELELVFLAYHLSSLPLFTVRCITALTYNMTVLFLRVCLGVCLVRQLAWGCKRCRQFYDHGNLPLRRVAPVGSRRKKTREDGAPHQIEVHT
ncbi:hypothetical protein GQ44DRAFT_783826 [Phaeosphaeriaceae sp. PMI808]|nr:hypothetical protein GQ44DRAFT_783826 [Phaeosphaeriaceae sp. PMI808]